MIKQDFPEKKKQTLDPNNQSSLFLLLLPTGSALLITRLHQQKIQVPAIVGPPFPYYSHTIPIRIPSSMGMIWEAYGKGVPLLRVPGSLEESLTTSLKTNIRWRFG